MPPSQPRPAARHAGTVRNCGSGSSCGPHCSPPARGLRQGAPGCRGASLLRALPTPDPPWVPAAPEGRRARRSPQRHQAASSMVLTAAPAPWLGLDWAAKGRAAAWGLCSALGARRGGLSAPQLHSCTSSRQPSSSTRSASRDWELARSRLAPPPPPPHSSESLGVATPSFTFSLGAQAWGAPLPAPGRRACLRPSHAFPRRTLKQGTAIATPQTHTPGGVWGKCFRLPSSTFLERFTVDVPGKFASYSIICLFF